jgi:selT/selW/selH-like putative selenoprotein
MDPYQQRAQIKSLILVIFAVTAGLEVMKMVTHGSTPSQPQDAEPHHESSHDIGHQQPSPNSGVVIENQETKEKLDVSLDDGSYKMRLLDIEYCPSLKAEYDRLYNALLTRDVSVTGREYPLPPMKQMLAYGVTAAQWGGFAILMAGDRIFPALGMQYPALYLQIREKKMMAMIGMYFIFNTLKSSVSKSGAFEVYLNGKRIFSKLESGRVPDAHEILRYAEK